MTQRPDLARASSTFGEPVTLDKTTLSANLVQGSVLVRTLCPTWHRRNKPAGRSRTPPQYPSKTGMKTVLTSFSTTALFRSRYLEQRPGKPRTKNRTPRARQLCFASAFSTIPQRKAEENWTMYREKNSSRLTSPESKSQRTPSRPQNLCRSRGTTDEKTVSGLGTTRDKETKTAAKKNSKEDDRID